MAAASFIGPPTSLSPKKGSEEVSLWDLAEVMSDLCEFPLEVCKNFVSLMKTNPLHYIKRYRSTEVGNLELEDLRLMKYVLDELRSVQNRMLDVMRHKNYKRLASDALKQSLLSCQTVEDVEAIFAPLKEGKTTLAARSIQLGLEIPTKDLLANRYVDLPALVDPSEEGLYNVKKVELGLQNLLAHMIAKDPENDAQMASLVKRYSGELWVSQFKSHITKPEPEDVVKFRDYIGKKYKLYQMKPHLILTLNRGEKLNVLSLRVKLETTVCSQWIEYCTNKYHQMPNPGDPDGWNETRKRNLICAINDACQRLVEPLYCRKIRSQLTSSGNQAAVKMFSKNMKSLLLTPALGNFAVLGIDPSINRGCSCAVVSPDGSLVDTAFFRFNFAAEDPSAERNVHALKSLIERHRSTTIAIGNGSGSRELQVFLSKLIQSGFFGELGIQFSLVNESGLPEYSCSPEAGRKFVGFSPTTISALSIARRLQDPFKEFLRVTPDKLGVGMYHKDLGKVILRETASDVVAECVSLMGVDVNTVPFRILRYVPGLNDELARSIIEHRKGHGRFVNREMIRKVHGFGPEAFTQSVGFLKIYPENSDRVPADDSHSDEDISGPSPLKKNRTLEGEVERPKPNPLDRTMIHPVLYQVALRVIRVFEGNKQQIGYEPFTLRVKQFLQSTNIAQVAQHIGATEAVVRDILTNLSHPLKGDMRSRFEPSTLCSKLLSMRDLKEGQKIIGIVQNLTDFGIFMDVGVERFALLHAGDTRGKPVESFVMYSKVEVVVSKVDLFKERINVRLDYVYSFEDLKVDQCLVGKVVSKTRFGAFFDIGTEQKGLVFKETMGMSFHALTVGTELNLKITKLDAVEKKITLKPV